MGRDPAREDDWLQPELDAVVPWWLVNLDPLRRKTGSRHSDRRRPLGPDEGHGSVIRRVHNRAIDLDRRAECAQVVACEGHNLDRRRANFGRTKPGRAKRRRAGAAGDGEGQDPQSDRRSTRELGHDQV